MYHTDIYHKLTPPAADPACSLKAKWHLRRTMAERVQLRSSQRLRCDHHLPHTARTDALTQCRLDCVDRSIQTQLRNCLRLRLIDKCAVRTADDQVRVAARQLSQDHFQRLG